MIKYYVFPKKNSKMGQTGKKTSIKRNIKVSTKRSTVAKPKRSTAKPKRLSTKRTQKVANKVVKRSRRKSESSVPSMVV